MHPFDEATALQATAPGHYAGATHPAYANMVGPFGGTTAAQLLNAALQHPDKLGQPIALTVNFAAPVQDGPIAFMARAVRTNRSTQHWAIEASQGDAVVAMATAVFAERRSTWSDTEAVPPQDMPPAEALQRMLPGPDMPAWPHRYDMRFAQGEFPDKFDEQEQPHSRSNLWVRDEPVRPLDFASLAAISDSFFPRIYIRRRRRALIGTVSMTTYFHADQAMLSGVGTAHVMATARALNYRNGYFDQSGEFWSAEGQLLASAHQVVYYKE